MRQIKYFFRKLFHKSSCWNCVHWMVRSPTWENPGGEEYCIKNIPAWWNNEGCKWYKCEGIKLEGVRK